MLLALSLSAESSAQNPSPKIVPKPNESGSLIEQPAQEQPSPNGLGQPINQPTGSQPQTPSSQGSSNNDKGDSNSTVMIFLTIGMLIATAVMAFATIKIAIFNRQLVGVTDEMKKATAEMAKAADAGLHLNRPAIVVTSIKALIGIDDVSKIPNTLRGYSPEIYNIGSGPAEIIDVFSRSWVFDAFDFKAHSLGKKLEEPRGDDQEIWKFFPLDRREFPRTFLGAGECFANYQAGFAMIENWIPGDIEKVESGEKRRAVYGTILYRSSVKEYLTKFFFWYDPKSRGFRRAERRELNHRT